MLWLSHCCTSKHGTQSRGTKHNPTSHPRIPSHQMVTTIRGFGHSSSAGSATKKRTWSHKALGSLGYSHQEPWKYPFGLQQGLWKSASMPKGLNCVLSAEAEWALRQPSVPGGLTVAVDTKPKHHPLMTYNACLTTEKRGTQELR